MPSFQPKLSLKVSQRQVLTPGLVQMVSVLALNKLELKEMISAEVVENPVLEEVEESVPLLDDVEARRAKLESGSISDPIPEAPAKERDPFDEIDFGAYFQNYLDPGFRTGSSYEELDRPSFENFLSEPSTLTDHLCWQLGSLVTEPAVRRAAELIIGNLDEAGFLTASDQELLDSLAAEMDLPAAPSAAVVVDPLYGSLLETRSVAAFLDDPSPEESPAPHPEELQGFLQQALDLVQHLDPPGIATRSLRECLLLQLDAEEPASLRAIRSTPHVSGPVSSGPVSYGPASFPLSDQPAVPFQSTAVPHDPKSEPEAAPQSAETLIWLAAHAIVSDHLHLLLKRDIRELSRAASLRPEVAQQAIDLIRTLDPHPGHRYNSSAVRLIEPDVAFVKRDEEYVVVMNEEDMPTLRLNRGYRRMLTRGDTAKDVRDYVKERYKSAIQLMRSIEQRKNTIQRTCESIVQRQQDFLERGVDYMRPMMIKEVAEEIGVHPSTVSRAVSNKYVHTPQGVFELRFFFSEAVAGPEGGSTPLVLLKRKVKKIIEEEDSSRPLTDDLIANMLQQQGIDVTRRTVAKYREDMNIPSTHQRRVRR